MIQSITELQNREKNLHDKFHADTPQLQERSLEEMEELMRLRVEMFTKLRSGYARDVEMSAEELEEQLSTLNIVENELQQSRKRLKELNQKYTDKMRMVEISTYFSEKYQGYNGLFKLIIIWMIPLGLLLYIGNKNPVPEKYVSKDNSNTIFLVLILLVGFVALYQILNLAYDLKLRNNMNFNEYNFGGSFAYDKAVQKFAGEGTGADGAMSVWDYNKAQLKNVVGNINLGCVDSSCCSDGTIYDSVKKRCFSAAKVHRENIQKAVLAKGSMGASTDNVQNTNNTPPVEAFSNDNVPFSSV